ncbi:MAG: hypothetical protein Q4E37_03350 [Tissierellia bacterium]|nr:hypothetical protein [Tissierellia bacterium]
MAKKRGSKREALKRTYREIFGYPARGIEGALGLLCALFAVEAFPGFDAQRLVPMGLFVPMMTLVYFALIRLLSWLAFRLFPRIFGRPHRILLLLFLAYALIGPVVRAVSSRGSISRGLEEALILGPIFLVLVLGGLFASLFLDKKGHPLPGALFLLALLCQGAFLYFLASPGLDRAPKQAIGIDFANGPLEETYQVEKIAYGPGQALDFGTTSLSHRAGAKGWVAKVRKALLGYDLAHVPYQGVLYLPKGQGPVPLLIFAHGNHNMLEDNALGYDYLGKSLAQAGFAFASIDASGFNGYMGKGVGKENDGRALLQLRHGARLLEASQDPDSPLYGRLDPEGLVVGGHSRGGEAAAIAALFNSLEVLPDDGTRENPGPLPIKGVLAVAPTWGQYQPADKDLVLEGPSYLLIHGSHDQDVTSTQGLSQYKNLQPGPGGFKASLFVGYANHGLFNEKWGALDKPLPSGALLNRADFLSGHDQKKVLAVYSRAFMEALFREGDRAIFYQAQAQKDLLPPSLYYSQYQPAEVEVLADFEEDLDPLRGTLPESQVQKKGLYLFKEGGYPFKREVSKNHVLTLKGGQGAFWGLDFPARDLGEGLGLDLGRADKGHKAPILVLRDQAGQEAQLDLAQVKPLKDPMEVGLLKVQHITGQWDKKGSLETFILDRQKIQAANPGLDLEKITSIQVQVPPHEKIYLDNLLFLKEVP